MRYIIRYGSDGIGLMHWTSVHTNDGIDGARALAAQALTDDGYGQLAANRLFTVHGVRPEEDI